MSDVLEDQPDEIIEDVVEIEEEFDEEEPEEEEKEQEQDEEEEKEQDEEDVVSGTEEANEIEEGENEEDTYVDDFELEGGSSKKKTARRNKNSKFIDYKTFQTIAKGGVSTNVKLGDEESEMNLRKFEGEINKDYLITFHPEIQTHNYDEIATLSTIVRNEEGQIVDNFHKTLPFVTKFERARILGVRAKQINSGASVMIDVPEHVIDGYTIAQMEYEQKKIPFIIKRPLPNGAVEYWKFADLEQINL